MKTLLAVTFAVALAPFLRSATVNVVDFDSSEEGKQRYLAQPYYWWSKGKFPVKPGQKGSVVSLTNERTKYVFFLFGNEESDGAWHPAIGMLRPSIANWSRIDFLDFSFGDQSMKNCDAKLDTHSENGFTLTFTTPSYEAKCSFELRENDDRLYMLFTASDETKVKLTCYPSSYGGTNYREGKELRKRYAFTNLRNIPMGKTTALSEKEDRVFFGDSYFDPAKNRGEGPCGIVYDPGKMKASVSVQNYPCHFYFTGKGEMPLILFDFHGASNSEGERIMRELPVTFSSSAKKTGESGK